jgi:hypothetical protein
MRTWMTGGLVVLAGLLVGAQARAAEEPSKEKLEADAAAIQHITSAYDLAAYGRKEKAPELLVSAAFVLRTVHVEKGDEKPKVEKGEESDGKPAEAVSLKAVSDKLLAEAREMAAGDKLVLDLADRVTKEKTRESVGGPRSYYHQPGAGSTLTWNVTFYGGRPASVGVTGNGRNSITLTVQGPGGHYATWTGHNPQLSWVPNATKTFTVSVTNNGPGSCAYTFYHN